MDNGICLYCRTEIMWCGVCFDEECACDFPGLDWPNVPPCVPPPDPWQLSLM